MVRSSELTSNFSSRKTSSFSSTHIGNENFLLTSPEIFWSTVFVVGDKVGGDELIDVSDSKSDS